MIACSPSRFLGGILLKLGVAQNKQMEDKANPESGRHGRRWTELEKKAKDDPEPAKVLEAAQHVIEGYGETLQRLADS